MEVFHRILLMVAVLGIFVFFIFRTVHFFKWRNERPITLVLKEEYCRNKIEKRILRSYLSERKVCLIKGALISPGIFKDDFYLKTIEYPIIHIPQEMVEGYFRPR